MKWEGVGNSLFKTCSQVFCKRLHFITTPTMRNQHEERRNDLPILQFLTQYRTRIYKVIR